MVKIVNGQIVPDDAPSNRNNTIPRQQSGSAFGGGNTTQLFPSTNGRLGSLSQNVQMAGYEMEMIWPLAIVGVGIMFGIKWSLILAGLLWLYNKNSQDANSSSQNASPSQQSNSGSNRDNSRNSSNKSQTGFKGIRDVRGDGMN